ncbi:MAG: biotin/lipoyl-containing protein [Microthrixaceae bacterium]
MTGWFESVGDTVTEDEPLFEVSTDKVDTEVPSPASGTHRDQCGRGETVDVGTLLADARRHLRAAPGETAPEQAAAPQTRSGS